MHMTFFILVCRYLNMLFLVLKLPSRFISLTSPGYRKADLFQNILVSDGKHARTELALITVTSGHRVISLNCLIGESSVHGDLGLHILSCYLSLECYHRLYADSG